MGISERYLEVLSQVQNACVGNGRDPESCLLLAVSKTVGIDGVAKAIEAGALDFGENRPDQLVEKHAAFPQARWHFIGNIQSRRIPDIVSCAHLIHSLQKAKHAERIDAAAAKSGKVQDVLIEVNVSGEESKSGVAPDDAPAFLKSCLGLGNVRVRGLMTMAPQGDVKMAEETFAGLKALKGALESEFYEDRAGKLAHFDQLSMGMSEDWREAIAQGSTIVRIGRAIFSDDF